MTVEVSNAARQIATEADEVVDSGLEGDLTAVPADPGEGESLLESIRAEADASLDGTLGDTSANLTASTAQLTADPTSTELTQAIEIGVVLGQAGTLEHEARQEIQQIATPSIERMIDMNSGELEAVYQGNRSAVESVLTRLRDNLDELVLSGRGKDDLEQIISERSGNYAGEGAIYVWGVEGASERPIEDVTTDFEEAAVRAVRYATLENKQRLETDPEPGGIIVMRDTHERNLDISTPWLPGRETEDNHCGMEIVSLRPENYEEKALGVIDADRFVDMSKMIESLEMTMARTGPDMDGQIENETPDARQARVEEYNEAYLKRKAVMGIMALGVIRDALITLDAELLDGAEPGIRPA